jgi:hypothetical protein
MIDAVRAVPTIAGKQALGLSSPDKPALHIPEPLSITTAGFSILLIKKIIIKKDIFLVSIKKYLYFR